MYTREEINKNLTAQILELEALQSVYPEELTVADHGVLADINDFIGNPTRNIPHHMEYSIKLPMNDGIIELLINLPISYPKEKPEVYARSSSLNRTQQTLLNQALSNIVEQQEKGEPCIYMLISWLQDNGENYIVKSNINQESLKLDSENKAEIQERSTIFARYWIYSHHIYGKCKRKDVAALAKENSITGFCLAGKPGVICIEGALQDCEHCWQKIKSMNWQKILIRLLEKEEECKNINNSRKFIDFREISFPTCERHNDLGQLLKYLTERELQHAFKELFGIEGKSPESLG
ncbi:RWD domain-containing protein 2A isoform X1 [Calliopsis andreniformis]|uniref:RWD domain-containing protein 2A isoform X1 n=1 Tax=Calliopsis andreniformis TaxID=337506 RepID=UPI003FCDFC20